MGRNFTLLAPKTTAGRIAEKIIMPVLVLAIILGIILEVIRQKFSTSTTWVMLAFTIFFLAFGLLMILEAVESIIIRKAIVHKALGAGYTTYKGTKLKLLIAFQILFGWSSIICGVLLLFSI